jgi:uncharacterized protein (TIGR00251 family)
LFFKQYKEGFLIRVKINPNKKINKILNVVKMENDMEFLKIDIQGTPVDFKANICLIDFLATIFELQKKTFQIMSGETNKYKIVYIMDKNVLHKLETIQEKGITN